MGVKRYRVKVTDANGDVIFLGTFEEDDSDKVVKRAQDEFIRMKPQYRGRSGALTFDIKPSHKIDRKLIPQIQKHLRRRARKRKKVS